MPENKQSPYDDYNIADWKWEFLRRNPRYKRAYDAIEWLRHRAQRKNTSTFFKGFGLLEPVHFLNLTNRLQARLSLCHPQLKDDSQQPGEWVGSLPSPERAADEFKYSPVGAIPVIGVYDQRDFQGHYSGHPYDEEPLQLAADENQVIAVIDIRCKLDDIISDLKSWLSPYLSKQREQLPKYKDYLAVWDLRHEGKTADEIAPALWPDEHDIKGGRNPKLGEKGALIQRVYDHESAAQKLIDETFPRKNKKASPTKSRNKPPS